jgi:hypothetical protein
MKSAELEAKVKTLAETIEKLEAQLKTQTETLAKLDARLQTAEDIEEIKKLQRKYGFYLTHWMGQEIVDLFSDSPDVSLEMSVGKFLGKEGIKNFYLARKPNPELLSAIMQLSGVVDVDPDGKTAKGRWFGYGFEAMPVEKGVYAQSPLGIYENEYVKEGGKWKFKRIMWSHLIFCAFGECWVKPGRLIPKPDPWIMPYKPDVPKITYDERFPIRYPSSRTLPFHYKHPVTGK